MIRRKGKKDKIPQDAAAVNRFGCGCLFVFLIGIVAAMIVSGYLQLKG